jgi:hypothetical protein
MTHHATNLDLPGESNITTAAGDVATFQSTGSNTVQCINYTRADGTAIVSSHTPEGTAVLSTGEGGGTKFLREDGDNSCSWQTAPVTSVSGSTGAVADGDIDHDSLGNFAANEHFTQANITATGTVASGVWQGTAVDGAYVDIEGTEVKSTGESGGTKFLREDGDGTCSWQAAAGGIASVAADGSPQLGGFLDANGNYMQTEKGGDLTSASPLVIDTDGDYFDVTGTTNFAAMTVAADRQFTLQFDGALTMTHHATNLDLPGEANITTAAGDVATFQSTGANTVQCINYTRADGTGIAGGGDFADGGEVGGAARTLGNTDSYDLSFLTNNVAAITVQAATGIVDFPNQSACSVYANSTQVVAHNTLVKVEFDTEDYDTQNEFDSSTNYRFTATEAGNYLVIVKASFQDLADAVWAASTIHKNGSQVEFTRISCAFVTTVHPVAVRVLKLDASDYIEGNVKHGYGSDRNHNGGTYNHIMVQKLD